ncbi:MAG TPA: PAS domain-containing protein [Acidimicrobiales bacterium]|nr:PAS domain-containing protein [Acidimicrobiales bacterium]
METVTQTLGEAALEASRIAAWRWDLETRQVEWSADAEEVVGLPSIVLRSSELFLRAIHPDDFPLVSQAYNNALRSGRQMEARFRVLAPSGVRWFDCAGRPILDDSGRAVAATGTILDVTDECEAEDAMLQTLRDAQLVLGEIGARVWEFDAETETIQYVSPPTGPAILENSADEELTLRTALERLSDQDAVMVRDKLRHAVATGEPVSYEVAVRDDEGIVRRVFVRGAVSSESPNRLTGVSIVLD